MIIKVNDLDKVVAKELEKQKIKADKAVRKAQNKAAKMAVNILHETSPKDTGGYAAGWTSGVKDFGRGRNIEKYKVIYNKSGYWLTYLLEKGHADVRHGGRVKPIVHIAPVEQKTAEKFIHELEAELKK